MNENRKYRSIQILKRIEEKETEENRKIIIIREQRKLWEDILQNNRKFPATTASK